MKKLIILGILVLFLGCGDGGDDFLIIDHPLPQSKCVNQTVWCLTVDWESEFMVFIFRDADNWPYMVYSDGETFDVEFYRYFGEDLLFVHLIGQVTGCTYGEIEYYMLPPDYTAPDCAGSWCWAEGTLEICSDTLTIEARNILGEEFLIVASLPI